MRPFGIVCLHLGPCPSLNVVELDILSQLAPLRLVVHTLSTFSFLLYFSGSVDFDSHLFVVNTMKTQLLWGNILMIHGDKITIMFVRRLRYFKMIRSLRNITQACIFAVGVGLR